MWGTRFSNIQLMPALLQITSYSWRGSAPAFMPSAMDADELRVAVTVAVRDTNWQSVADAVLYLAQARDVTGQIIFADGGAHLNSYTRDFMHL